MLIALASIQIAKEGAYPGPHCVGHMYLQRYLVIKRCNEKREVVSYDPNALPNDAIVFIKAKATAPLAGVWDTELLAQDRKHIPPA